MIFHEIAAKVGIWSLGGGQTLEPRDIVQQIRNRYYLAWDSSKGGHLGSLGGGQTLEPRDIVQQIRNRYDLAWDSSKGGHLEPGSKMPISSLRPLCFYFSLFTWSRGPYKRCLTLKQGLKKVLRRCFAAANAACCIYTNYRQFQQTPCFVHWVDAKISLFIDVRSFLRRWTWTGDFKCREVKTGFFRNRSMQTGSSGTLIGWKSGQTTFVPLWDWMEGAWLRTLYTVESTKVQSRWDFIGKLAAATP